MDQFKDDEFDNLFLKKYHFFLNHKTLLLPISFILPSLNFLDIFKNFVYLFFSIMISLLILTWNFPLLSHVSYNKPIYYDDLISNNNENNKNIIYNLESSNKFKKIFITLQQILLSFTMAIMFEYISFKYKNTEILTTEFIGILGGLLSLYLKITKILGKIVLIILYKLKKRENDSIS